MTESRRHDTIAIAILVIVPTIFFLDVLAGINVLYLRDVTSYHHPSKFLMRQIVLAGEFPYWNPWYSAGQPLAANPHFGVFYPLTWLILLPDFDYGFQLLAVIHIHIACLGMYAFLRSIGLGRPASVFGGLSFGLATLTISLLNLWPCLFSFVWLPLSMLYTRTFIRSGSRRALAAASCFLGLQVLVGEPVTTLLTGLILGLYAVWHGWRAGGPLRALRATAAVALISFIALLVSAVQTIPAIDLLGDSVRSRGLGWELVRTWSWPFLRGGEFFFPHFLGFSVPDERPYWGAHLIGKKAAPLLLSIYCGLSVAIFSVAGVIARVRGTLLFIAITVVSLLLAAGENAPLLRVLYDLGVADSWRYPEKFVMMIGFASVVFAAVVLDRLLQGDVRLRRIAIGVAAIVASAAGIASIASYLPQHRSLFAAFYQTPFIPADVVLETSRRLWMLELARGLFFLFILHRLGKIRQKFWLASLGLFVLIDLAPLAREIAPRYERSYFDPPPLARAFTGNVQATRLVPYAPWQDFGSKFEPYNKAHSNAFWMARNGLSPRIPADVGIRTVFEDDFDLTALLPTVDFNRSVLDLIERNSSDFLNIVLSMSNGGYVTLYERPEISYPRAAGDLRRLQPTKVIKGPDYPRYYFASLLVTIRDRDDFVDALLARRYPRDVAFIREPSFDPARGVVHRWSETVNSASIEVESLGRGFLVMSVTPHKYWRVAIDGREVAPIVTNIGYQGLVIPPGRHIVTMQYANPLIPAGAAISLATLLVLVVVARRRAPATMRPL